MNATAIAAKEAAKALNISVNTLYNYVSNGCIPQDTIVVSPFSNRKLFLSHKLKPRKYAK
jgi:predicted site-specific integrase-resolvase